MKKGNFKNKLIAMLGIILTSFFAIGIAFADSGWDSSYGGGSSGGYSGGSSWSSGGSSWDYDDYGSGSYHSSGSSSSELDGGETIILFIVLITIIIIILLSKYRQKINGTTSDPMTENTLNNYKSITEEELKKYLPNYTLSKLEDELYNNFIKVQESWSDFDYDKMRELCTDELYNTYKSQLEVLKIKKGKNIMDGFNRERVVIFNIKEENGTICVSCALCASFHDYVIDENSGNVTRGDKNITMTNIYQLEYIREKDNSKDMDKCPSCGAPIEGNTSSTCEYCGSTIVYNAKKFVLSKKIMIRQFNKR